MINKIIINLISRLYFTISCILFYVFYVTIKNYHEISNISKN